MKIISNFISKEEMEILSYWIIQNKDTYQFKDVLNMGGHRKSTRFSTDVDYPKLAYDIQNRIINTLQLKSFNYPPFPSGIVASFAYVGDKCFQHTDPIWYRDMETIHCNIVTQIGGGADITIDEKKYNLPTGDLMCYNVCRSPHEVGEVLNSPRLLWVFGFCITLSEWERIIK